MNLSTSRVLPDKLVGFFLIRRRPYYFLAKLVHSMAFYLLLKSKVKMGNVLFIEDDPGIQRGLITPLTASGFEISAVTTLVEARHFIKVKKFEVILLDVGLPDGNGIEFCQELRDQSVTTPILLLTAQVDVESAVQGLKAGANDYLRKPYQLNELVQKLKNYTSKRKEALVFHGLTVSAENWVVTYEQREIRLPKKEFEILALLLRHANGFISRERIISTIDPEAEMFDRTVDTHVSRLRKKLQEAGVNDLRIVSRYGMGYRIEKVP